ncbi:hypothetical protein ACFE04_011509 [Oxalis oulophora]
MEWLLQCTTTSSCSSSIISLLNNNNNNNNNSNAKSGGGRRVSSSSFFFLSLSSSSSSCIRRPIAVAAAAASNKSNNNYKKPDDEFFFPEALLLKQKKVQQDGQLQPDFADEEEMELFQFLNLPLETQLPSQTNRRHYELVYLIHEKHDHEVDQVNQTIQDFLKEKKGKVWRFNDWGLRRLAYKIKKAKKAHYFLTNFELEAKWINDFKTLLDQDERIIRHLVIKKDEAETEDCPPPPEFHTVCSGMDSDEEDDDDDIDYEDEDEDWDEETELDGYEEAGDVDVQEDLNYASSSVGKSGSSRNTEKVGR